MNEIEEARVSGVSSGSVPLLRVPAGHARNVSTRPLLTFKAVFFFFLIRFPLVASCRVSPIRREETRDNPDWIGAHGLPK